MDNKLFVGQDAGSAKMFTKAFASNAKRLAKLREEEEEERKRRQYEEANQKLVDDGIAAGELNSDGSEKNLFQQALGVPGAMAKGFVDSAVNRIGDAGDLVGRTYEHVTGIKEERDNAARAELEKTNKERSAILEQLYDDKGNDKIADPEERAKLERQLKGLENVANNQVESLQQTSDEDEEALDTRKHVTNAAETALDLATMGIGGSVIKGGIKQGAKLLGKETAETATKRGLLATAAKNTGAGAGLGAAYSGIDTARDENATAGDYATNMATGAGLGAGLGLVGGALAAGIGKGIGKLQSAKNPQEVEAAAQEIVQETRTRQDAPKQLGAGYREPAEIESDIMAIQNGEDVNVFRYTDTAGNDVTSQVADFDKEIRARQTAIRDLQQQADGIDNNTGQATIPEGVDPSEYAGDAMGRANATEAITKLQAEVADLTEQQSKAFDALGGVQKELDPELAKARFAELQEELEASTQFQEGVRSAVAREEAQAIDVNALNREEADLKAGIVPDEMLKPFTAVQSADDVRSMMLDVDPFDNKGFIKGADEIQKERYFLQGKLDELYTGDKYDQDKISINQGYNEAMQAINDMPEPVRAEKAMIINEQVMMKYDEIDGMLEEAAEEVADVQRRMAEQDALEQAMIQETRAVQISDPDLFRPIDNDAVEARLQEIKYQKLLASEAPDPIETKEILSEISARGEDVSEVAKTNEAVARAVDTQVETQAVTIMDNTGKSAGFGWFVGTPTKVIEKFGPAGKQVSQILRKAVDKKEKMDGDFEYQMEMWGRLIRGKNSTEKVAKALDGDEAALKELTPQQNQAYSEIKEWFKTRADELGLPEDARIKDYLPHLFEGKELDLVERTLAQLRAGKVDGKDITPKQRTAMENELAGIDAQTLGYLASKNTYIAKNGFLKKRKGAKDYSMDLEKILTAYHSASSSTVAYKPAVSEANKLTKTLTKEQNTYVNAVFKNLQGETDTVIERSIDGALKNISAATGKNFGGEGTTSRLSRGTRSAIYNATIGANVGSAVRNTQQMVNVFTEVGAKGVTEAAPRALAALKKNSPMREILYRNGVLSNRQGSYLQGGAMPKFKDKGTKVLWGMFNTTETLNRATAFFAGYDKHLAKFPKDIAGAEKAGAELAQKTNFKFSAIDIPVAMQGDMAKNFLQMQTYNVQQSQYLFGMFKDAGVEFKDLFTKNQDGKFEMKFEAQAKVARFLGGNALFFGTVGAATGMNWQEAVPFWNDVKAGAAPRSPMTQIVFGDGKGQPGIAGAIGSGASALFTGKWDEAAEDADTLARAATRVLAPGGNQAVKTIEGAASATSGLSTTGSGLTDTLDKGIAAVTGQDPSGNIRFAQGDDAWSKFRATVLGQYAGPEGRDWVDEGMNNVPTNMEINGKPASDYIKDLPRAAQEQYISYYSTKGQAKEALESQFGSRTAFKNDLVSQLRNGDINYMDFSSRMNEYNTAVADQMASYLEGNDRMPARLRDDLLKNMFIAVKSPEDYEPREQSLTDIERELEYTEDDYDW